MARGFRSGVDALSDREALRYTETGKTWSLLWRDRNLRFHEYDRVAPSARVDDLLSEIDRDPTAIFWG